MILGWMACAGPAGGQAVPHAAPGDVDGLRLTLTAPERVQAGETVELGLRFHNVGDEPLRLYFLAAEPFRFHSLLKLSRGGELLTMQPDPRPHGIVVDEADFPLVQAGETFSTTQSLSLAGIEPGPADLGWRYHNDIVQWEGGRPTMDGPTKELFGGERIPFIWTGEAQATVSLRVMAP